MQRPASATVFGILNIVFAALGFLGILASVALFFVSGASHSPVVDLIRENPVYAVWMKISIPLGFLSCAALLVAGIGLLLMKPWARKLSIIYAIYALVIGTVSIVINFIFLLRPMLERAGQHHGPEAAGALGGAIGGTFGGCLGLIYPILVIIFMMRPKLIAAFQQAAAPPPISPV